MKKFVCTFIITIILALLFSFLLLQMPKSSMQDTSAELEKEALTIISDIIGLDKTKYNITLQKHNSEIWGGVYRDYIDYTLESPESKTRVMMAFSNQILTRWTIHPLEGIPIYNKPLSANPLDLAKETLQRYQTYSKLPIIQETNSMLKDLTELKDVNITKGDLKMRIRDNIIDWVRKVNGLEFSIGLSIKIANGIVDNFVDESSFYRIGSAEVNINREEAIRIALEEAKTFTTVEIFLGNGFKVFPFQVKEEPWRVRLYVGYNNFTMYPCWEVRFAADPEVYSVTGVAVYMRADTGEITNSYTTSSSWNIGISHEEEN